MAERCERERRQSALCCLGVGAHFGALAARRRAPLPEPRRRIVGEDERVRVLELRLVAARLDSRDELELIEQACELSRGRLDHPYVAGRLLTDRLVTGERAGESGYGGERRAQVMAGQRDERGEAGVHGTPCYGCADFPAMSEPFPILEPDLQATAPEVRIGLSRAGVTGLSKAIRICYGEQEKLIAADLDCTVDLDPGQKGVHMSRFPELFEEAIEEVVIGEALLVEVLAEHIAQHILERQQALRAEVKIAARYPLRRTTPVTGLETQAMVGLHGIAAASDSGVRRLVGVDAVGINACPCAQGLVRGKAAERLAEAGFESSEVERIFELVPLATHNQRGRGTLFVGTDLAINAEQLVELVEGSMSAPVYELLKRPDELFVVEHAHLQPRFVEDSVRLALRGVLEVYPELEDADFLFSRQVNLETIHSHDVLAERYGTVGELRAELERGESLERHTELRQWVTSAT
jgi:GTP cyclohydrolase IV